MRRKLVSYFVLPLILLLGNSSGNSAPPASGKNPEGETGTLEKMIVANGNVALDLDLNRLNGIDPATKESTLETLRFQVGPNSFFTVLVFNDMFRGPEPGLMGLVPENTATLPGQLQTSLNQLVIEKLPADASFDLAVRDAKTGFVFFNVEGNLYEYDAAAHLLAIKNGRLLISEQFARDLGRPADAGVSAGRISIATTVYPIEITTLVNGAMQSSTLPPARRGGDQDVPNLVAGPDVIVGDLSSTQQFGTNATQVGVAVGTTSCNNGTIALHWFSYPNTDHPVIPQNLYRMSGGASNDERFEQIGQSWLKHAFAAAQGNFCGFGCTSGGSGLGPGCSDPYGASLNASQGSLGSRAWVNPFTGVFPSNSREHGFHSDASTAPTHRALVNMTDLNTTMNPGATYFAEAQYVTPHEYAWCQANPGQCNMYNNVSYRQFNVSGTTSFTFAAAAPTVRMTPAINAWPGATINQIEPEPGADGRAFMAYKVTNPSAGVWHYEYALYNQNLDRSIQSFSVPLGCGITLSNVGFHAPLNHPGIANDGTQGDAGYSNAAWISNQTTGALTWSTETFAQNQNANAIRWGTMYNFRFDSDRPPLFTNATIGYFKNGAPSNVVILAPNACNATPTPVPTPTPAPTPTPGVTPTPTPSPTGTPPPPQCGTFTFSNTATINIPGVGAAAPYPSNIAVALGGTITKVTVKLNNLSHTFPADIDVLLVGPGGQNAILMSDVGGGDDVTGITLTLDDAAANSMPVSALTTGTFKPTNAGVGDTWPAPAPAPTGGSPLAVFNGTSPNGTWSLYVVDDASQDLGSFGGGWELNITTNGGCTPDPATPTPTPTVTPTPTPTATTTPTPGVTPPPSATPTPGACGTSTHSNTTTINIPEVGAAAPYPSSIFIFPTSIVTKVTVKLINFSHPFPADVDVLLVGPGGQNAIIMSDVGGGDAVTGVTLLLDDDAPNSLPASQLTSGVFKPTNTGVGDTWPAPAPAPSGGSALSVFNWTLAGGTWSLYVVDDSGFDLGSIAGGWELTLTTTNGACPTPTPTATLTPGVTPTPTPTATISPPPPTSPTPTPSTPTPTPIPGAQPTNLSTRMRVQTGDNVGIGGFIITGTAPKHVLLRAIGPSLTQSGVPNALADPVLELHGPGGFATITNDNWRDDPVQEAAILATGMPPTNNVESAIDATLSPGAYTAVVKGKNNTSGVALVEIYDLSLTVAAKLANISTRALVGTGDNIVIAGFTLGGHNGEDRIVVRGLGPSLAGMGVTNVLADPTLELRDANGALLITNNDWQDHPFGNEELIASGLAPTNQLESGIAVTLPPGAYTALLAGFNNGAGIGLVEVYDRGP